MAACTETEESTKNKQGLTAIYFKLKDLFPPLARLLLLKIHTHNYNMARIQMCIVGCNVGPHNFDSVLVGFNVCILADEKTTAKITQPMHTYVRSYPQHDA